MTSTSAPSAAPTARAGRPEPEAPDFHRSVNRFMKDEDGQSMVEFVIIAPVFLFLIMGIIQFMLIADAAYFVNYGNFMAMRTAVAHWEMSTVGLDDGSGNQTPIPDSIKDEARNALRYALLPIGYFKGDRLVSGRFLYSAKIYMSLDETGNWLKCYSEYDYPLIIPLASNIIHAIAGGKQGSDDYYADVLPYDPSQKEIFGITLPAFLSQLTLRIKSNSGLTTGNNNTNQGDPHMMLIHRRW